MPSSAQQSLTVDYLVSGSLDGSTAAPEVEQGNTSTNSDSQIYEPKEVEQLGTIDPDLGTGGSIGLRCISQLLVDLRGAVAPAGARVFVAAQKDDELVELHQIIDMAGQSVGVAAVPFVVPQGAVVVLEGMAAGSEPILVRISIDTPEDPCQVLATLAVAEASGGGGNGGNGSCPCLRWSDNVLAPGEATMVDLQKGIIQRYDASALQDDELEFRFPTSPVKDEQVGIKEWANSFVAVRLNGQGATVETATAAAASVQSSGIARQSLTWQYDGVGTWRLV